MTTSDLQAHENVGGKTIPRFPIWVILILAAVYTLSYLDRQVVNIVAEHIKQDLGLADWQIGAVSGLSFALLYATLGIPVARIAERSNRGILISIALVVWSACTAVMGFAQNFWHLALARFGVGLGESGCTPPAMSLIADVTDKEQRPNALAIYNLGVPVGALLGMVIGGYLVDLLGWRSVFFVVGPPGIFLAIVILAFVKDPRSQKKFAAETGAPAETGDVPSMSAVAKDLAAKKSFWWITTGACLTVFVGYSLQAFLASFFLRTHSDGLAGLAEQLGLPGPTALLGIALGIILGLGGAIGTLIGGQVGRRWKSTRAYVLVPAIGSLAAAPFYVIAFLLPGAGMAMVLLIVPTILKSLWYGPVYASIQGVCHPRSRATAIAIFLFLLNAIGLGLGPLSVGIGSDFLSARLGEAEGLRWAMIVVSAVSALSAFCFLKAAKPLENELVE
ncbi:MFS transporter [uncultured Hyphomonas sp.]|uniref:spinster family MFS transporter n=1 Tax=uncultured Hyphomonas sp. TaxID=225298 RepID=UPI002AABE740|nr:MFS transporter [uncultured Hyphomonas sp.]